jgi:hypothetical protein
VLNAQALSPDQLLSAIEEHHKTSLRNNNRYIRTENPGGLQVLRSEILQS